MLKIAQKALLDVLVIVTIEVQQMLFSYHSPFYASLEVFQHFQYSAILLFLKAFHLIYL